MQRCSRLDGLRRICYSFDFCFIEALGWTGAREITNGVQGGILAINEITKHSLYGAVVKNFTHQCSCPM
jgi:hypothetical protein